MPWVTITLFLPLIGIPVLLAWPRLSDRSARLVTLGVTVATFGVSLAILASFDRSASGFQLLDRASWVGSLHLQYLVGVDGISLFLVFQLHTFDFRVLAAHSGGLPVMTARWLFLGFLMAFAVKAPLVPFHSWQPDAYTEAPTGGLLILAGILPKIATYGLLRFNLGLFPEASRYFSHLVAILALVGIVYGAVVAIMQTDLKRLIAYSSISHVGLIVLGIFAFTQQGASGSVLYMVNHALSTGALFLLVGMLYERTRTRDVLRMGGIQQVTPKFAAAFLFVGLASMGLPGLNNFVSEFLVILGAFTRNRVWGAVAASAVVLSAIYILWAYQRAMHGPVREEHATSHDLRRIEYVILVPVLAAILFLGVYPKPVLDRINPSTCRAAIQQQVPGYVPVILKGCPAGWTLYEPLTGNG